MCSSLLILPKEMEMSKMQSGPPGAANLKEEQSRHHSAVLSAPHAVLPFSYGSIGDYPLSFF